jgi:hypothetical protein
MDEGDWLAERFEVHVIALENMRGRFSLALGIGAAGFSEGHGVRGARGHLPVGTWERGHELAAENAQRLHLPLRLR